MLSNPNTRVVAFCISGLLSMAALTAAAVPLYKLYCQVTGSGGTTQRAAKAPDIALDRSITVRFDANVAKNLPWAFEPVQRTMDVKIGENALAFYRATNNSKTAITGTAVFNVSPDAAGMHFSKIECFCFKEQRLEPGETVDMPVSFFVDPALVKDRAAAHITEITLSYRFYPVEARDAAASATVALEGKKG